MAACPFNIRRKVLLKGVIVLLSVIGTFHCTAQSNGKLPDSVNTTDEAPPPVSDSPVTRIDPAEPVVLRSVPDSAIARYKKEKDFEYANDPAYWKIDSDRITRADNRSKVEGKADKRWRLFFRLITFIIIGGSVLLILYSLITQTSLRLFYKAPRKMDKGQGKEELLPDDDLDGKIQEATRAKDHRMATRYLFLKALRLLDQRQLIHYQAKATNREYVLQMSSHRMGTRFGYLADAYDHVWYGNFSLDDQQFSLLTHYFEDFYKTLSRES